MSKVKAAPPPGCSLNISDPQVQEAAIRIQASYRGHRYQNVQCVCEIQLHFKWSRARPVLDYFGPMLIPILGRNKF